jgi:hypothetical protein
MLCLQYVAEILARLFGMEAAAGGHDPDAVEPATSALERGDMTETAR